MKKTTWIGAVFFLLVLGYLVISSFSRPAFRCQVCITYQGRRNCATAAAKTRMNAQQTAATTACATISSGVIESSQCENTTPDSVDWLSQN